MPRFHRGCSPTATATAFVVAVLLAAAPFCQAEVPAGYQCTCVGGQPTANCVCPSTLQPGGLQPRNTPQFLLFAHDDGINATTYNALRSVTDGRQSLNGCPAVATMFAKANITECDYMRRLYDAGYQIGDHTENHVSVLGLSKRQLREQIVQSRAHLAACGIPESDVVGFRAPFLQMDSKARKVAHQAGYLYDSSIVEMAGLEVYASSLSYGGKRRVWPFTMQDGVPINCKPAEPYASCNISERYKGMWEVPVWDLHELGAYTMDYGMDGNYSVFDILKANFDAAYAGNRAPMPLYIHTPWLLKHVGAVQAFADYALSQPNVYFITIRQLLAWMSSPVPADQLTPAALGCGNPGGAPSAGGSSSSSSSWSWSNVAAGVVSAALDTGEAEQGGTSDGSAVAEAAIQELGLDVDSSSETTAKEMPGTITTYRDTSAGSAPGGAPAPEGASGPAAVPGPAPELPLSTVDVEPLTVTTKRRLAGAESSSNNDDNANGRGISTAAVVVLAVAGAVLAAGVVCWVMARRRRAAQAQAQAFSRLLEACEP